MRYNKKEAVKVVIDAAKEYHEMLANKNFLVIYRDRATNRIECFETLFLARNFQHLTGLEYVDSEGNVLKRAVDFYEKSRKGILREAEIRFKSDGTTDLKLKALPKIINFCKASKMTTTMDNYHPFLNVDRLTGNVTCCLGFAKEGRYYYPSSCLLGDIRNFGKNPSQILAVLSKSISDKLTGYDKLEYSAKGIGFEKLTLPVRVKEYICEELLADKDQN